MPFTTHPKRVLWKRRWVVNFIWTTFARRRRRAGANRCQVAASWLAPGLRPTTNSALSVSTPIFYVPLRYMVFPCSMETMSVSGKKKGKHTQNYKNSTLRRALRTRLSKRVPPPWLAATFLLPCTGRPPPTSEQTSCGHSSRRTQSRWLGNRRAETNTSRRASITYPRHELSGTAIGLPISWGCFEGQCRHICGSSIGRVWGWPSEFATRHCKRGTLPDAQAPDSRAIHDIPAVDPRNTERRHHQTTASAIVMRESWSGAI